MNKRRLHHLWTKLQFIKPWYFLVIAVISLAVCIASLRANNEHMIKLRNAVAKADQYNTNVQQALQNLQAYVTTHMNTNLSSGNTSVYPPIQLKYTYDRLAQAQADAAAAANTQLYTDAQHYCEQQDPVDFSGHNRVPCIEQYVLSHDTKLPAIPTALYEFDFVSPRWSSDLAGWSLVIAILGGLVFVVSFLGAKLLRRLVD